jgi:hypothetical protein
MNGVTAFKTSAIVDGLANAPFGVGFILVSRLRVAAWRASMLWIESAAARTSGLWMRGASAYLGQAPLIQPR